MTIPEVKQVVRLIYDGDLRGAVEALIAITATEVAADVAEVEQ